MKTFSGYTKVFKVYSGLNEATKAILRSSAFDGLISAWEDIARRAPRSNLVALRAFIDRFWDTTVSFHLVKYEAGITGVDFAMVSGLPFGDRRMNWDLDAPRVDSEVVIGWIGEV